MLFLPLRGIFRLIVSAILPLCGNFRTIVSFLLPLCGLVRIIVSAVLPLFVIHSMIQCRVFERRRRAGAVPLQRNAIDGTLKLLIDEAALERGRNSTTSPTTP